MRARSQPTFKKLTTTTIGRTGFAFDGATATWRYGKKTTDVQGPVGWALDFAAVGKNYKVPRRFICGFAHPGYGTLHQVWVR